MSTDRELLEKAARAAGIVLHVWGTPGEENFADMRTKLRWNPLTDDGDALRLAVKLRLDVLHNDPQDNDAWVMVQHMDFAEDVDGEASRPAATRRAIVRAAAALGGQA